MIFFISSAAYVAPVLILINDNCCTMILQSAIFLSAHYTVLFLVVMISFSLYRAFIKPDVAVQFIGQMHRCLQFGSTRRWNANDKINYPGQEVRAGQWQFRLRIQRLPSDERY